jgi:hypothetical protein
MTGETNPDSPKYDKPFAVGARHRIADEAVQQFEASEGALDERRRRVLRKTVRDALTKLVNVARMGDRP